MDTLSFFKLVLPEGGPAYLLGSPVQFKDRKTDQMVNAFGHHAFKTLEELAEAAVYQAGAASTDLYMALASYDNLPSEAWSFRGFTSKKGVRVAANARALRAFWLDIDVKPEPKPGKENESYRELGEAVAALKTFVLSNALPKPYVVSSGGGLHVYWPLTENIEVSKWQHYATVLKNLTIAAKLRADHSITADCARVLRPVGAFNWKTGTPRPVQMAMTGEVVPVDVMIHHLARLADNVGVGADRPKASVEINVAPALLQGQAPTVSREAVEAVAHEAEQAKRQRPPSDPAKVIAECQQLRWQRDTKGAEANGEQWRGMIACIGLCEGGETVIHELSCGHPEYSREDTDRKIAYWRDRGMTGGTLCETFERSRPGGCDGCPHRGKVSSPVLLGRDAPTAAAPVVEFFKEDGELVTVELPEPDRPYRRVPLPPDPATGRPQGVKIVKIIEDSEGTEIEVDVYGHDLYPVKRVFHQRDKKYMVTIRGWLPHDGWIEFDIDQGTLLSSRRDLAYLLGSRFGVACEVGQVDNLVDYMLGYIRKLQKEAAANVVYVQLGFTADKKKFVLPERIVTSSGVIPSDIGAEVRNTLKKYSEPIGTLEGWKEAAAMLNFANAQPLQFGLAASLAAPIFHMTGFVGGWVNLRGAAGAGKTLGTLLGATVWGSMEMLSAKLRDRKQSEIATGDTPLAFFNKFETANTLPVIHDEITGMTPEAAGKIAYFVTQGHGRARLDSNGVARESAGEFSTLLISTSNDSILSKFAGDNDTNNAQAIRVFEVEVPSHLMTKDYATELYFKISENFGHASVPYAMYLMTNYSAVMTRVRALVKAFDKAANVTSADRFWSAYAASMVAALEISNAIGLTNWDVPAFARFCTDTIMRMQGRVVENTNQSPTAGLDAYLRANFDKMLHVIAPAVGTTVTRIGREPRGELRMRYEQYSGLLFIERAEVRRWMIHNGFDPERERDKLISAGVLDPDTGVQRALAAGTNIPACSPRCWKVNMNHPLMANSNPADAGDAATIAANAVAKAMVAP